MRPLKKPLRFLLALSLLLAVPQPVRAEGPDFRAPLQAGAEAAEQGRLDEALVFYRQALQAAIAAKSAFGQVSTLYRLGILYTARREFGEALKAYHDAEVVARQAGMGVDLAYILNNEGELYRFQGHLAEAVTAVEEAVALARRVKLKQELARFRNNLGLAYTGLGRYEEALEAHEEALALYREAGEEVGAAIALNNIGTVHQHRGQHAEALAAFEEALAVGRKRGIDMLVAACCHNIGDVRHGRGEYEQAIAAYQEALAVSRRMGDESQVALVLGGLGRVYVAQNRYSEAMAAFGEALPLHRKLGREGEVATTLNDMAVVESEWGRFERALPLLQEALAIHRKLGREADAAVSLNNIGNVYRSWGQDAPALAAFGEALAIDRRLGREAQVGNRLGNIGLVHLEAGRLKEAAAAFEEALAIHRKLGREPELALHLNNLGGVYRQQQDYARARQAFEEALAVNRRLGREAESAIALFNVAGIERVQGHDAAALGACQEALAMARRAGRKPDVATMLAGLGFLDDLQGRTQEAIAALDEAVGLLDEIRRTAEGEARRDYMASQIHAYRMLVTALAHAGRAEAALAAGERARARMLAEAIADAGAPAEALSLAAVQRSLGPDEAILVLTPGARGDETVGLLITPGGAQVKATPLAGAADTGSLAPMDGRGRRGVALVDAPDGAESWAKEGLAALVAGYRSYMARPDKAESAQARAIGQALYAHLVAPFEAGLAGVKRLTIVPDGSLGLLPFETLVGPEGAYMVERFDVSYVHSLTVRQVLRGRAGKRQAAPRPMLALGGAVYAPAQYPTDMAGAVAGLRHPRLKQAFSGWHKLAQGETSLLTSLKTRGLGAFGNLPGTLAEVDAIAESVPGAEVLVGPKAAKSELLARDLSAYRVLHFATHGVADFQRPEASGLLLSVGRNEGDALLAAPEVARLKLGADFVCLSACQTGVGKVMGGEGVVGLSQAFLQAGANGLAMSLWSVDDAGTAAFMAGLYRGGRVPDAGAIAALKRAMRADPRFRSPYFWAPFVYYGR